MSDQDTSNDAQETPEVEVVDPEERQHLVEVATFPSVPQRAGPGDILMDPTLFEHAQRVAKVFASSVLVPQHMRGKVADCLLALAMARRLDEDPLVVMQSIYIVSGKAGWSAQYMIARANRSGIFANRINWRTEGIGDSLAVTAYTKLADSGEKVEVTTSMAMAKAEGWTKSDKYRSMGEHMLRWRSATMLIRLYAPEIMLGYSTVDELQDVRAAAGGGDNDPRPEVTQIQQPVANSKTKSGNQALRGALGIKPTEETNPFDQ